MISPVEPDAPFAVQSRGLCTEGALQINRLAQANLERNQQASDGHRDVEGDKANLVDVALELRAGRCIQRYRHSSAAHELKIGNNSTVLDVGVEQDLRMIEVEDDGNPDSEAVSLLIQLDPKAAAISARRSLQTVERNHGQAWIRKRELAQE